MPFLIRCKNCQKQFQTSRKNQGTDVPCPACGHLYRIPVMPAESAKPIAAEPIETAAEPPQASLAEARGTRPAVQQGWRLFVRLGREMKLTLFALGDALRRLGSFGGRYFGERRASKRLNQSLAALGEAMARRRVGPAAVLNRLEELDSALATAKEKKLSTKGMESERRILLIQLGEEGLGGNLPHKDVEQEFSHARESQQRHAASEVARQSSRAAVAPPAANRLRVAIGSVVVGCLLFFLVRHNNNSGSSVGVVDGASYVTGEELQWSSSPDVLEAEASPYAQAAAAAKSGKPGSGAVWNEYVAAYKLVTGRPPVGVVDKAMSVWNAAAEIGIDKSGWVRSVRLKGSDHNDEQLELLRELPHLVALDMRGVDFDSVTDRGLQSLSALSQLQSLDLAGLKVSEQAVSAMRGLRGLRYLDMSDTRLTDRGMATLAGLQSLSYLNVANTKITEQAVPSIGQLVNLEDGDFLTGNAIRPENVYRHLSRLTKLKNFHFLFRDAARPSGFLGTAPMGLGPDFSFRYAEDYRGLPAVRELHVLERWQQLYAERKAAATSSPLTGHEPPPDVVIAKGHDVLAAIRGMTQLQSLSLDICPCEDNDLAMVEGMQQAKSIDLSGSRLTAAGYRHLVPLAELCYLNVSNSHASKDDLMVLKDCPRLTDVLVNNCHLTPQDIQELEAAMPRARFSSVELLQREPYADELGCLQYLKANLAKASCPHCRAMAVTKQSGDVFDPANLVKSEGLQTYTPFSGGSPDELRQLLRQWGLNP